MLDTGLLAELGLTPKEAEIVVHMANALRTSKRAYFEAAPLAREVGIPREKIYTYLKNLEERGAVETTGTRPKSFALRPLNEVLDNLASSRRRQVEADMARLDQSVEEAKRSEYASLLPRISVLRDRAQYLRAMIETIRISERVMIIARTSALILPWAQEGGPTQLLEEYRNALLRKAEAGKLSVDYLIPFDYTRRAILDRALVSTLDARRALATMRDLCVEGKIPNIAVRNVAGTPAISLIVGRGRVAVGFTSEEEARTARGVLVESRDFFEFMASVYYLLSQREEAGITRDMVDSLGRELDHLVEGRLDERISEGHRGSRTQG
jgi:sugar-specific transcriptional regulator TrmB